VCVAYRSQIHDVAQLYRRFDRRVGTFQRKMIVDEAIRQWRSRLLSLELAVDHAADILNITSNIFDFCTMTVACL